VPVASGHVGLLLRVFAVQCFGAVMCMVLLSCDVVCSMMYALFYYILVTYEAKKGIFLVVNNLFIHLASMWSKCNIFSGLFMCLLSWPCVL
jgi:hypothetical protein